ncbi:MAG: NMD3-related protein, partial [Thermoplasmata archaeon]
GIRKDIEPEDVEFDISLEIMHEKLYKAKIDAKIIYFGLEFEEEKETEVRVRYSACDRCSKMYGGYYEAIVQVRADNRKITSEEMKEVKGFVNSRLGELKKSSRSVFISKEEELREGLDFYVGSIDAAKQIAKSLQDEFGGEYIESSKLHTRKEGREIYRMTYLVRFPKYRRKDIISMKIKGKEKVLQVKKIYPKKAWLKDLTTGKDVNVDVSELENVRVIGGPESIQEAVVVSRNRVNKGFELQILEPTTYRTVTIREPEDFELKGQYVKIVKYDEQIFLVYE